MNTFGSVASEIILITGISGSGKSEAIHALEDVGYFCVDNLPPELLREFLKLSHIQLNRQVAIAVDVRSTGSLPQVLPLLEELRNEGFTMRSIFLDATSDTLVRRFSETRRPHPLTHQLATSNSHQNRALVEAIELERELLSELREVSLVIDTSNMRTSVLRTHIRDVVQVSARPLTLIFESFAFKHGVPLDADYVFDVRVLPNPYYIRELRPLTGRDKAVASFLHKQADVTDMIDQIEQFLLRWLSAFEQDQRSYLTIAIGCTGGQHRSVYIAEQLMLNFKDRAATLIRHRELEDQY